MAQTKRKRRRKHRGTQGGRVDTRPRGRPRTRAEAKQRAQARGKSGGSRKRGVAAQGRSVNPPSWRSAAFKGVAIAVFFFAIITFAFGNPAGPSAALAGVMSAFYVPMAYYTDRFFYNRQKRKAEQERVERSQQRGG